MFEQDFEKDFDTIVEAKEPFALVRFHDGEHAILESRSYNAASGWSSTKGKPLWLRDELLEVLRSDLEGLCLGITPPCCLPQVAGYYRSKVKAPRRRLTFATLFSHRNFARFPKLREALGDAFVVSSGKGDLTVPKNGVTKPWDIDAVVDELLAVEKPILVAAGPCSNLIICRYWKRQEEGRRQTILDIGSAMDEIVHGKTTRHYHDVGSSLRRHACSWDGRPQATKAKQPRRKQVEVRSRRKAQVKKVSRSGSGPTRRDVKLRGSKPTGVRVIQKSSRGEVKVQQQPRTENRRREAKGAQQTRPKVLDSLGQDVVITVLTGRRPGLLERTLKSFSQHAPSLAKDAHVVVLVNGGDAPTLEVLEKFSWVSRVLVTEDLLPIGSAFSYLMENGLGEERSYVLHLEDDWQCCGHEATWFPVAASLLKERVGQVRLRHAFEHVMKSNALTHQKIHWKQISSRAKTSSNAHFTFNPSLVSVEVMKRTYPCADEFEAMRKYGALGLRSAQVLPGAFIHLGGEGRSLADKTGGR